MSWYIPGREPFNALDLGSLYSLAEVRAVGALVPLLVQPDVESGRFFAACVNEEDQRLAQLLIAAIRSYALCRGPR